MRDHHRLEAWREAREVSRLVIRACQSAWKPWGAAVFGQLQRSALSVQLNIAEGASFGRSPTYTRHLGIAYGSAIETGELLELARDTELLPRAAAESILEHSRNSQRLLVGLLKRHRPFPPRDGERGTENGEPEKESGEEKGQEGDGGK